MPKRGIEDCICDALSENARYAYRASLAGLQGNPMSRTSSCPRGACTPYRLAPSFTLTVWVLREAADLGSPTPFPL
jgi:hypothetical protein